MWIPCFIPIYSPLNLYLIILWILDFKYILLLLLVVVVNRQWAAWTSLIIFMCSIYATACISLVSTVIFSRVKFTLDSKYKFLLIKVCCRFVVPHGISIYVSNHEYHLYLSCF